MKNRNKNKWKCKGKWRRQQEKQRSIIDYVTTNKDYVETIKSMERDEEKQYGVYKTER